VDMPSSALPTRDNIDKAMNELAGAVSKGDETLLYFSGHGSYMPDSVRDGSPVEPDGTDEIFLPLDIGEWSDTKRTIENALIDDDIEKYISHIQASGAFVWMVADFCHSGFSSRDGLIQRNITERERRVSLKIPDAIPDVRLNTRAGFLQPHPAVDAEALDMARFVGFYASKSNQPTFEFPVETGPGEHDVRYHGVLTWNLVKAIRYGGAQSYQALATRIRAEYWNWGQSRVTPVFDGNLNHIPMLGSEGDDLRAVTKDRSGEYAVGFGGVDGVEAGSKVSLLSLTQDGFPKIVDATVSDVGITNSKIVLEGAPDIALLDDASGRKLDCDSTDSARSACRLLSKDPMQVSVEAGRTKSLTDNWYRLVGAKMIDRRSNFDLKIGVLPGADGASRDAIATLLASVTSLHEKDAAGFSIHIVDGEEAGEAGIYLDIKDGSLIFLTEPSRRDCLPPAETSTCADPVGAFRIGLADASPENVYEALRRFSKARNILALAGSLSGPSEKYGLSLRLDVADPIATGSTACADPSDPAVAEQQSLAVRAPTRSAGQADIPLVVGDCDVVGLTIRNGGRYPLDVTALYVTERGQVFWLRNYPDYQRGALRILPGELETLAYTEHLDTDETTGVKSQDTVSLVALATVADLYRDSGPDFRWLEQQQIAEVKAMRSMKGENDAFGDLLESAAFGAERSRSADSSKGAIAIIRYTTGAD